MVGNLGLARFYPHTLTMSCKPLSSAHEPLHAGTLACGLLSTPRPFHITIALFTPPMSVFSHPTSLEAVARGVVGGWRKGLLHFVLAAYQRGMQADRACVFLFWLAPRSLIPDPPDGDERLSWIWTRPCYTQDGDDGRCINESTTKVPVASSLSSLFSGNSDETPTNAVTIDNTYRNDSSRTEQLLNIRHHSARLWETRPLFNRFLR